MKTLYDFSNPDSRDHDKKNEEPMHETVHEEEKNVAIEILNHNDITELRKSKTFERRKFHHSMIPPKIIQDDPFILEHFSEKHSSKRNTDDFRKMETLDKKASEKNLDQPINEERNKLQQSIPVSKNAENGELNLKFWEFFRIKFKLPFIKLTAKEKFFLEAYGFANYRETSGNRKT